MISLLQLLCFTTILTASVKGQRQPSALVPRDEETLKQYSFSYAVNVPDTGNDYSHGAVSNGNKVSGEYQVLLPDGRRQMVTYTADADGYNADIQYIGEAIPNERLTPRPRTNRHSPRQSFKMYKFSETNGRGQQRYEDLNSASQNHYPARPKKMVVYEKDASDAEFKNGQPTRNGRKMKKMVVYKALRTRSTESQNYTQKQNDNTNLLSTGSVFDTFSGSGSQIVNGYQLRLSAPKSSQGNSGRNSASGATFGFSNVNNVGNISGSYANSYHANNNNRQNTRRTTANGENLRNQKLWTEDSKLQAVDGRKQDSTRDFGQNTYKENESNGRLNVDISVSRELIKELPETKWGENAQIQNSDTIIGRQRNNHRNLGQDVYNNGENRFRPNEDGGLVHILPRGKTQSLWENSSQIQRPEPFFRSEPETSRNTYSGGERNQAINEDRGLAYGLITDELWEKNVQIQRPDLFSGKQPETRRNLGQNTYNSGQHDFRSGSGLTEQVARPEKSENSWWKNAKTQTNDTIAEGLQNVNWNSWKNVYNNSNNYEIVSGGEHRVTTESQLEETLKTQKPDPAVTRHQGSNKHFRQNTDRRNKYSLNSRRTSEKGETTEKTENQVEKTDKIQTVEPSIGRRRERTRNFKPNRKSNYRRNGRKEEELVSTTEKTENQQSTNDVTYTTEKPSNSNTTYNSARKGKVNLKVETFPRRRKPVDYNSYSKRNSDSNYRRIRSRNTTRSLLPTTAETGFQTVSAKILVTDQDVGNEARIPKSRRRQEQSNTTSSETKPSCRNKNNALRYVLRELEPPQENCQETSPTIEAQIDGPNRWVQTEESPRTRVSSNIKRQLTP